MLVSDCLCAPLLHYFLTASPRDSRLLSSSLSSPLSLSSSSLSSLSSSSLSSFLLQSSVEQIVAANRPYMAQFFAQGTTTVEVKSGYGLTTPDEIKSLEAIAALQEEFSDRLRIVPTFMGAHAVPVEFKEDPQQYVDLVCK
jgi:imidazolonepropionase-like amidohydrolase